MNSELRPLKRWPAWNNRLPSSGHWRTRASGKMGLWCSTQRPFCKVAIFPHQVLQRISHKTRWVKHTSQYRLLSPQCLKTCSPSFSPMLLFSSPSEFYTKTGYHSRPSQTQGASRSSMFPPWDNNLHEKLPFFYQRSDCYSLNPGLPLPPTHTHHQFVC